MNSYAFTRSTPPSSWGSCNWTPESLSELLTWCESTNVKLSIADKSSRTWTRSFYSINAGRLTRVFTKSYVADTEIASIPESYSGDSITLRESNGSGLIPHIGGCVVEFLK